MSRIVLVRHGETMWHAQNRYAGCSDIALTSKGLQQAEQLAGWACGANLAAVWSSTLLRARFTAQPIAAALGLPLRLDERLVELDFGSGEGLTDTEMKEQFPEERAAFMSDPVAHHLPGGEDPVHAAERGMAALYEIAAASPSGRSLVIMHNTLIRLVVCRLLGIPLARYRLIFPQLSNGTITEIDLSRPPGGDSALLSFNAPFVTE